MTPIERYRHLVQYWKQQVEERRAELAHAGAEVTKWNNKLVAAEIAERLAKEDEA